MTNQIISRAERLFTGLFTATIASLVFTASAQAVIVQFTNFSSTSGLTLNGNALGNVNNGIDAGRVLRLTSATTGQSGSAFATTSINAATFSTAFKFRITSPGGGLFDNNPEAGADGIVFVVQNVSASIGGGGGGIGYEGIPHSVGAEFDTWHNSAYYDPNSNHLGIDINGSVNHGSGSSNTLPVATRFDDGNIWFAWVDYDGTNLEVRANQTGIRPLLPDLSRTLNIVSILGSTTAYVGFTSGTGSDWGNHDIIAWEYRDTFNPIIEPPTHGTIPEPVSATMVLLNGCVLACYATSRRRRQIL